MSDLITTPIRITTDDRDNLIEVQRHYEGLSRAVLQRAAMRLGLRAALDDPACLGPYLVSPSPRVTRPAPVEPDDLDVESESTRPATVPTTVMMPTAVEEDTELEDFGEGCDFAPNPFAG